MLISVIKQYLFGSQAAASFADLKVLAEKYVGRTDHAAYEKALRAFDEQVDFLVDSARCKFVGSGKGRFTLNAYRKLGLEGESLFEKVYAADSLDWKKCSFFYQHLAPELKASQIRVPALREASCGKRLAIARFEFLQHAPLLREHYLARAMSIVQALSTLEVVGTIDQPDFVNLDLHFGFERCYRKTDEFLRKADEPAELLRRMRMRCEAMPRFVGHGDLSLPNLGQAGLVLDWDNFGFYPPGFDLALVLVLEGREWPQDALEDLIEEAYTPVADRCDRAAFGCSILYFYCVFLSTRKAAYKLWLWRLLKSRFA